jgi:hypothetical protein
MKRLHRPWLALLTVAIGIGLIGCQQEGGDTRNIVEVYSLNGNVPLLSDVYNYGDNTDSTATEDDFIPVDIVEVTFLSRRHDPAMLTVQPGTPFGSVTFHTYEVRFGDGGGVDLDNDTQIDLANFTAPMNTVVPIDGMGQGYILIISGGVKAQEPISCLGPVGGACGAVTTPEYSASATITFHGTEDTSGDDVTVTRGLAIRIAQFGDK